MKQCAACRRDAPASVLEPTLSVLDCRHYDTCPSCVDNRAEPVVVVINTVNDVGWSTMPKIVRDALRVYDHDEYITVGAWARRMKDRQLVPCDPDDNVILEEAQAMVRRIKSVKPKPPPRARWFTSLFPIFPWRAA